MVRGMAISRICTGFSRIALPWKANMIIRVSSNPMIVTLPNLGIKHSRKWVSPLCLIVVLRVITPLPKGITTNSKTESSKVSHGTDMPPMPKAGLRQSSFLGRHYVSF